MKFSIITPTYNRESTISRAIDSILSQTYDNWELIIIDDASNDNTLNIIQKYLTNPKITYKQLDENSGVCGARNEGLRLVSKDTEWIAFLDSDDSFPRDALEKMIQKIKQFPEYKYFSFSAENEKGQKTCKIPYDNFVGNFDTALGKYKNLDGEFNKIIHISLLKDGFKFEDKVNGYEWIAWLRLSKKGIKCLYTSDVTRIYFMDTESLIRTSNKTTKYWKNTKNGIEIILNEFGEDIKRINIKKYALYLYTLANANIKLGNKKEGLQQTFKAIKVDFFNLRWIRNFINVIK